jgi:hypothetical protein
VKPPARISANIYAAFYGTGRVIFSCAARSYEMRMEAEVSTRL